MPDISAFLEGTIGEFQFVGQWPDSDAPDRFDGYLEKRDELIRVQAVDHHSLAKSFGFVSSPKPPVGLLGETPIGGILLLDGSGSGSRVSIGGGKVSSYNYRYRSAIAGSAVRDLRSPHLFAIEARFPSGISWGQMPALEASVQNADNGKARSASISVGVAHEPVAGRLPGGLQLTLSPVWSVDGPDHEKRVRTALGVEIRSRTPRPVSDLLAPILEIQQLISIANAQHADCRDAIAVPHGYSEIHQRPAFWNRDLSRAPAPRVRLKSHHRGPQFTLPDLGGALGVRRWITFVQRNPRFVRPVTLQWMLGQPAVETRILELYAAVEQYVEQCKSTNQLWAKKKGPPALIFSEILPSSFKKWVGDVGKWADEFRKLNNIIKHDPISPDPLLMSVIGQSAELAITSVALDHASQRRVASRNLIENPKNNDLGVELRRVLA